MNSKFLSMLVVGMALTLLAPLAVHAADADPLFADDSILEVTITAPFKQIMRERPEEEYVPATFGYLDVDGIQRSFDIGIRTRGEFRRRPDICPFAPLRVNFKKKQLDETIFDGQDKLKLVTHCSSGSKIYAQTVVSEYLVYRILNLMTDVSFRARLVRLNYVYADNKDKAVESYAFFIEHKDRVAKRLQVSPLEMRALSAPQLDAEHSNLVSVFHYLIGNTDFSPFFGPPGELCCHNHEIFGLEEPPFWSVPYDFDQAGLVNAPHANPSPRFKLRTTRQRLYRGRCFNVAVLPSTLARFRSKRGEIEALINAQAELEKRTRSSMLSFIESFYKTLDSEKRIESQLVKACI